MSAIGPGDWVECVDASNRPGCSWDEEERVPVVGALYQVSDAWFDHGTPVILVGWERAFASRAYGCRKGFGVWRFRLTYRPKADLIESLKTPAKREGVPA